MHQNNTIAAISTAPGIGAIAIVRLSGPKAISFAEKLFSKSLKNFKSHTAKVGKIFDRAGYIIDESLLLIMKSPNSYTGEDIVEIHCHGGTLISQKILQRVFELGAKPAKPGEFTLRAFLNNKMDLAQAEAVQELISAKNELFLSAAEKQLSGELSKKIEDLKKELTKIAAILEAWVDFPEEGLEFKSFDEVIATLTKIISQMQKLSNTFHDGQILSQGISLCITGTPNVGKSSLMNALLKKEKAIVTPIAGTTRDVLEEDLNWGNLHFRLIDTAGIRKTEELIEEEGIKRAKIQAAEADIVLLLLDISKPLNKEDIDLLQNVQKEKTIVVLNKIDLQSQLEEIDFPFVIKISAKEKIGLDKLQDLIEKIVFKNKPSKEELIITKLRHKTALDSAISFCQNVINGLKNNVSCEFVTSDIKFCLNELNTIIGSDINEDILSSIFANFCIGK